VRTISSFHVLGFSLCFNACWCYSGARLAENYHLQYPPFAQVLIRKGTVHYCSPALKYPIEIILYPRIDLELEVQSACRNKGVLDEYLYIAILPMVT
jgi:hypothetical protein